MFEDFFNSKLGFVLEGKSYRTAETARAFLMGPGCMEQVEADGYLTRLVRDFKKRTAAAAATAKREVA